MSDPWQEPGAEEWVKHVLDEMAPKLAISAMVAALVPGDGKTDVKMWVELGASIYLNKPIIVILLGDQPCPPKLELIADEIVRCPEGIDTEASAELQEAVERIKRRIQ